MRKTQKNTVEKSMRSLALAKNSADSQTGKKSAASSQFREVDLPL
jgi:hypothetical protein